MAKQIETQIYQTLDDIVKYLRSSDKKYKLLFAHNGVGKTRLSVSFKDIRKSEGKDRDTLYFNAYTEDLFTWDNDLDNNTNHYLVLNENSHFFDGMEGSDIENKVRPFLHRFVDFDFKILPKDREYPKPRISFLRTARCMMAP